jgi:very-short-patch-repair endonuclease
MRDAGLEFRRQVDLGGEHWTGRVDFLHEVEPLVVEVQSERYHSALVDREADQRRLDALRANGFRVLEITDTLIWSDPAGVERCVRDALRRSERLHL